MTKTGRPRVVASIEARMTSSRLPGKVLMDIGGKPSLSRMLDRVRRCGRIDDVVLATTTGSTDDVLEQWGRSNGVAVHRGSEEDVLHRVVCAHRKMRSDVVVELTGDCPLLDPDVIDLGVDTFFENECDVVSNTSRLSFPQGADVQVFRLAALEEVERTVSDPAVREHVSLFFYEHPERYRILHLMAPPRWRAPELRFQLDYEEDLRFLRTVYDKLQPVHGGVFGVEEVLGLLRKEPEIAAINRDCVEKPAR